MHTQLQTHRRYLMDGLGVTRGVGVFMCQKEGWLALLALMLCVKEYYFNATQRQHLFVVD